MDDHVDDDSENDADDKESNYGEVKRKVVVLDEDIPRQLAKEGYVLCEDEKQPDHDDNTAEDEEYFTQACHIHRKILA
jgi:hypothetical protein